MEVKHYKVLLLAYSLKLKMMTTKALASQNGESRQRAAATLAVSLVCGLISEALR
jgi:hypothetical protein